MGVHLEAKTQSSGLLSYMEGTCGETVQKKAKNLWTDSGGENTSKEFEQHLNGRGNPA